MEERIFEELGIAPGYRDYRGRWVETAVEARTAVAETLSRADAAGSPVVIGPGTQPVLEDGAMVMLEDGTVVQSPADLGHLPLGYHRIVDQGGRQRQLIVGPGRCFLPDALRAWGWALQLYAVRSEKSWGMGDLADLERLGRWCAEVGAATGLLNPLHAVAPGIPQEPSPYYPGSRVYRNPLYLSLRDVPGVAQMDGFTELDAQGRELNGLERIDRDRIYDLKMAALEGAWATGAGRGRLEAFLEAEGDPLERFAAFCAIAEREGPDWREWPPAFRSPRSPAVQGFAAANEDRIAFHAWLQWLLDVQLKDASRDVGWTHDLAVGVDPGGADAWSWQDCFATGATVGAPPDDYNLQGQDWAAAAFDPGGLRTAGYEPFIATLRAAMRYGGGLRIDHVMGLFRLYLIPAGRDATDGAYVSYPSDDLLQILCLESHRAGCFVIGEDLGTVEDVVRSEMQARRMLSYKLMWFEDGDVASFPHLAMAAANTHDLPTAAGLWTGAEDDELERRGIEPNRAFSDKIVQRIMRHLDVARSAEVTEVVDRSCEVLAATDCAVVTASLEDALASTRRLNRPGSVDPANWSAPLPLPLEDVVRHPRVRRVAGLLGAHGRGGT